MSSQKEKLIAFYKKHNKKMLEKVDLMLAANAGEEDAMFEAYVFCLTAVSSARSLSFAYKV